MWVNLLLVLLCWIAAGLPLGMVLGRMIAFADKALADEPNQPSGSLQEAGAQFNGSTPRYRLTPVPRGAGIVHIDSTTISI
jgi:hypothetical protein